MITHIVLQCWNAFAGIFKHGQRPQTEVYELKRAFYAGARNITTGAKIILDLHAQSSDRQKLEALTLMLNEMHEEVTEFINRDIEKEDGE